jgi:hypothetical protein
MALHDEVYSKDLLYMLSSEIDYSDTDEAKIYKDQYAGLMADDNTKQIFDLATLDPIVNTASYPVVGKQKSEQVGATCISEKELIKAIEKYARYLSYSLRKIVLEDDIQLGIDEMKLLSGIMLPMMDKSVLNELANKYMSEQKTIMYSFKVPSSIKDAYVNRCKKDKTNVSADMRNFLFNFSSQPHSDADPKYVTEEIEQRISTEQDFSEMRFKVADRVKQKFENKCEKSGEKPSSVLTQSMRTHVLMYEAWDVGMNNGTNNDCGVSTGDLDWGELMRIK